MNVAGVSVLNGLESLCLPMESPVRGVGSVPGHQLHPRMLQRWSSNMRKTKAAQT